MVKQNLVQCFSKLRGGEKGGRERENGYKILRLFNFIPERKRKGVATIIFHIIVFGLYWSTWLKPAGKVHSGSPLSQREQLQFQGSRAGETTQKQLEAVQGIGIW